MYDSYVITSFCREVVRRFQANYPDVRVPSRCGIWASQGNESGNAVKVTWASPARATAGQVVQ